MGNSRAKAERRIEISGTKKRKEGLEGERQRESFELEKLKLIQIRSAQEPQMEGARIPSKKLSKLLHKYDTKENICLYIVLFERQASRMSLQRELWVTHLLGLLPQEITQIIARESKEKANDYDHVKKLLLKRFQLTLEKFRQLFNISEMN
ncbi:uncharacterized protein NPIL_702931 [Nephila pilipes]|uniref:Uncharacterized protein n=1 Tax=Nephila pilipes TaxID=299642 RepID=A0A8X6N159_NEPPI|nr:uncharacterized protein NPIL_702931 [Nephila pilipes]